MWLLNKIQNIIKHVGTICFAAGTITACNEYDASVLNMYRRNVGRNEYGTTRTDGDNESEPIQSCGPLCIAAQNGHEACAKALTDIGADMETRDKEKDHTALVYAAICGHEACVRSLIEVGADVNACNYDGSTALIFAARYDNVACLNTLIKAGANVDVCDKYKKTALIYMARYGHKACVEELINAGADVHARDQDRNTALDWAARYQHRACIRALGKAMSKCSTSIR